MAGGGGGGSTWKVVMAIGTALCLVAFWVEHAQAGPGWLLSGLLAVGGLAVIFGACEAMILCVEALGQRLRWNRYVAGAIAGLASNVPEVVMLGFIVAKEPRVAFVVACLTLHVNALVFGVYSGLLPRDKSGHARLPDPLVKLSTDLYACAAGIFLVLGLLMIAMHSFETGDHRGEGLGKGDLIAIGLALLAVEVVSVIEMVKRFAPASAAAEEPAAAPAEPPPGWGLIALYFVVGVAFSFLGGHAIGDFAGGVVAELTARGHPEMVGAIVISLFAGVASYLMIASAHFKGLHELALSNVSGAITQQPFVVLPCSLILMAIFASTGVIPTLPHGGVLSIDLETTSVVLLGFPTLLILWKAVSDDGMVNKLETTVMVAQFGLAIYLLAQHG